MKIAFYAPLKPPGHPHPSGDRLLAQLLIAALSRAGHEVHVASALRTFEGAGNESAQRDLRDRALAEADALINRYSAGAAPDLWFSYHVYHKAPDWIGPKVADALGLAYVVAEASLSPRQENGPWREGHRQARHCISRADAMVALNRRDLVCTVPLLGPGVPTLVLAPFIDLDAWPPPATRTCGDGGPVRLAAVAMMRPGDKQRSWEELCDLIAQLPDDGWTFDAVGDGALDDEIQDRLRAAGGDRVRCHGRLEGAALAALLDRTDLVVWPAVNEAFGMALLEAQSRGAAVFAGRRGGVAEIVAHGRTGYLYDPHNGGAARALAYLVQRPKVLARMGETASRRVRERHGLDLAAERLDRLVRSL